MVTFNQEPIQIELPHFSLEHETKINEEFKCTLLWMKVTQCYKISSIYSYFVSTVFFLNKQIQ